MKPLPKASVLSYDTIQKLVQLKLKDLADYVNEVETLDVCADMPFKDKFSMVKFYCLHLHCFVGFQ